MPKHAVDLLLRDLRLFLAGQNAEGQTDRCLLDQFLSQRDEASFAALLERHGRMVLGVCRRVLHDEHLAEDAFQATFLILARQAAAIRKRQSVGSWLHGVAWRLALKTKAGTARFNHCDLRSQSHATADPHLEASWQEAKDILDDELQRLPENYRLPLILCYLEGLTRDEAAAQLGWSVNKLKGLLDRGRDRLRSQLIRRGVALSAAGSATLLSDTVLAGPLPPLLAVSTIRTATLFAAGSSLAACGASAPVAALTQGALKMMASKKLTVILTLALFTAVFGSGVGMYAQRTEPVEAKPKKEPPLFVQAAFNAQEPNKERVDRFGDPLPAGAVARLGTLRFRHPSWVSGLAFTPDGATLASACWDANVRLWDAETGKETRVFRPDEAYLRDTPGTAFMGVAMTPDGKTLIALQNHDLMHVWDIASGKARWQLKGGNGFAMALSADGKIVAKGLSGEDNNKQISLWDVETGNLIRTLGATDRTVISLAFSRDGMVLAAGESFPLDSRGKAGATCSTRLWDPTMGRQVGELKGHTGEVTAVAFSPDDKLLATASHDGAIRLWKLDGKLVRTIAVPEERPTADEIGPDNRKKGVHFGGVVAITFSPNGQWLASGGYDGCVRLWDSNTGQALHTMPGHGREVKSVVFSRDGKVLASGGIDHTIRLWDPSSGKELQPREGHRGPVRTIAISPDGKSAAAVCHDRVIHVWSLVTGQKQLALPSQTDVYGIAFSPDGLALASGSTDEVIRIWDPFTGREVRQLRGHEGAVYSVAFTPVGNMLVSSGADRILRFWGWSNAKLLRQFKGEESSSAEISRDGRVIGVSGPQAKLLDAATGKELRRLGEWPQFALAPNGRSYFTIAKDGLVQQRDIATGQELVAFRGPDESHFEISPDGRILAIGDGPGSIALWEITTGKMRRRISGHHISSRQSRVFSFTFSPDGRTLLTGGEDTTILIWDLARRHESQPARLAAADLDALWRALGGDDAERADRAIGTLAARADQSVPFLNKHLGPAVTPEAKRLAAWIADLDSGQFGVRDKAFKALQRERDLANAALTEALDKKPSLETRRRIEDLLAKQRAVLTASELLQSVRAVEILEQIDDIDARRLLQKLSTGASHARITQEANDAWKRLERLVAK